ncbi:hypothetical protein RC77_20360 [Pectobacterium brasiliense]|nr:hypothetical protein RC77_20360 [Pectobacterium brasiliense]KHS77191.1 hypothetical protein RC81_19715 [Pectobacterium brasiliense]
MTIFLKKVFIFILNNITMFLFSICFFWICYILFVGYAPRSEKTVHLIIAVSIFIGLGKLSDWFDKK